MHALEGVYVELEKSIRLMALIHLLWWNTNTKGMQMIDAITIFIM